MNPISSTSFNQKQRQESNSFKSRPSSSLSERVNKCDPIQDLKQNPKSNKRNPQPQNKITQMEGAKLQQQQNLPSEEDLVVFIQNILKENNEPMLIMKLGHALQFKTQNTGIAIYMREKFRGLLSLLHKYGTLFSVTGTQPKFMVSLNGNPEGPPQPVPVPLTKEMNLLTKYKTVPCQHFSSNLQCSHELCNFAHGERERRRNPMSPFFVAYGPILCPDRDESSPHCIHGKSCVSCCNQLEFTYHPENYRIAFCKTTSTRTRCLKYPVCSHAHSSHELRGKISMEENLTLMAYCARYQMWARVHELIKKHPSHSEYPSEDVYCFSRETAFHYAAKCCRSDVIIALLNKFPNFNVNQRDIFGQTPLHKAAAYAGGGDPESDWQETFRILIEHKGDPCLRDYEGHDAFYFAKKNTVIVLLRRQLAIYLKNLAETVLSYKRITIEETEEPEEEHPQPRNLAPKTVQLPEKPQLPLPPANPAPLPPLTPQTPPPPADPALPPSPKQQQSSPRSVPTLSSKPKTLPPLTDPTPPLTDPTPPPSPKQPPPSPPPSDPPLPGIAAALPLKASRPLAIQADQTMPAIDRVESPHDFQLNIEDVQWLWKEVEPPPPYPIILTHSVASDAPSSPSKPIFPTYFYTEKVPLGYIPCPEKIAKELEKTYQSKSNPNGTSILKFVLDSKEKWTADLNTMIQTCPGKKDRKLSRIVVSKQAMYIRERTIKVDDPRLVIFKGIEQSRAPVEAIASTSFTKHFAALINTINEGETAKIYFGINEEGRILGVHLKLPERQLLPGAIWSNLEILDPCLTGLEYEMYFTPVCSGNPRPITDLFVLEVHIKKFLHPVYFIGPECWIRRDHRLCPLNGVEILEYSRLRQQRQISAYQTLVGKDLKRLKDLSIEELEKLEIVYQKRLETASATLEEKKEKNLREGNKDIQELEEQLQSYKKLSEENAELLQNITSSPNVLSTNDEG
jgi:hypothetical protein